MVFCISDGLLKGCFMDGAPVVPQVFTISALSSEFAVTTRTLRFYETRGLLEPKRRGQTRLYSRRDRARLKLILQGKRVGFSLSEIKEMLDLYDLKDGQTTQLQVSLKRFKERITDLERQKLDIEEAITDLKRTCKIVEGMLEGPVAR